MVNLVAKLNLGETGALIQEFNEKLEKMQINNLNIDEKVKKQDNHCLKLQEKFDYLRTQIIQQHKESTEKQADLNSRLSYAFKSIDAMELDYGKKIPKILTRLEQAEAKLQKTYQAV